MENVGGARVILIDTNGFGAGKLSGVDLTSIEQMVNNGVKVVVPDVVCRELSVHASESFSAIRFDLLIAAGFKEFEGLRNVDGAKIYDGIVQSLKDAGCDVRESEPAWWMEAVLTQIAVVPPAEKKSGVRTGAADSVVTSHARQLQHESGALLVISDDSLLISHLKSIGIPTAPNLQAATGRVLNNASPEVLLQLLDHVWGAGLWRSTFVDHIEKLFSAGTVHDLEILGFSNLVAGENQMYGTTVFSLEESSYGDTSDGGPNDFWSKGKMIFSAQTKIDTISLLPTEVRKMEELSSQTNYDSYPFPTEPQQYVRIEQSCITDPQVNATFEIAHRTSVNATVDTITVRLDGVEVATVELNEFEVERSRGNEVWFDRHSNGVSISGKLLAVDAPAAATTAGYLGSRVLRLWTENRRTDATRALHDAAGQPSDWHVDDIVPASQDR
jgi:rRNA-processing protein FCF1